MASCVADWIVDGALEVDMLFSLLGKRNKRFSQALLAAQ